MPSVPILKLDTAEPTSNLPKIGLCTPWWSMQLSAEDEVCRLKALAECRIVDSPPEEFFDEIAEILAHFRLCRGRSRRSHHSAHRYELPRKTILARRTGSQGSRDSARQERGGNRA